VGQLSLSDLRELSSPDPSYCFAGQGEFSDVALIWRRKGNPRNPDGYGICETLRLIVRTNTDGSSQDSSYDTGFQIGVWRSNCQILAVEGQLTSEGIAM
jgi:hypothetical protein